MRIEDVSEWMVFQGILDEYGLRAVFIRQPSSTGLLAGVNIYYGVERMDAVVSLSVSEYKKIGFDDLPELCEYWKMLAVFR